MTFLKQLLIYFTILFALCCNIIKADDIKTGRISGSITTSDNKPATYVTVAIEALNRSTTTNENGYYSFGNIKPGTYTLKVTFVGAVTQKKEVIVTAGKAAIADFTLTESLSALNEVNITAARYRKSLSAGKAAIKPLDLPQTTGTVSKKVIEDQQINRLGDAVRNVSGVTLTQTRGGVGETITARGYSIGITGTAGSIFKNGVLANTAGLTEASTLESIEILKGSAALLYGNVSGGLVINMITRKPQFKSGGEVSMRYGSNSFYKPLIDLYGPISQNVAFRLVTTYENSGSYRDQVKTKRFYINPSLLFNLDKKTTLLLEADYSKQNLTPDWGIGSLNTGREIPTQISRSQYINTNWAYNNVKQYSGTATLNHKFDGDWNINAIVSVQTADIDSYGSGLPNTVNAAGEWNRGLARAHTNENNYTAQTNLKGKFNTGAIDHQILAGIDAARILSKSNAFGINNGATPITTYVYDKINIVDLNKYVQRTDIPNAVDTALTTAPVYRVGVYAQDLISITDKLKVLAGIRWSWQQTYQTTIQNLLKQTTTGGAAITRYDRAFSPKLALIYQPAKTTSVYATYSNNFQVNSGNDIYTGQGLKPSIVDQYEAGIKNEFFDGKLSANFSVYRIINNDLAVTAPFLADGVTPNSDATKKQFNGQTTSDGLEVDVNGYLSNNLYFIVGYAYNFMRYTKTSGLKGSSIAGEQVVINPRNTANASLFYTFSSNTLRGFKVGASAFYTGSRLGGYNNTVGQTQAFNRLLPVGGFATLNVTGGYTYKKVSLLASVNNVTNTLNYLIHDNYSITPIAPRQFLTTLTYKF
ncbi:MAG: TonB-dependent receptor [Mucilaginibacter sp.]|nr:TonB-dependent receptor [Mucilaginibacter sp.]